MNPYVLLGSAIGTNEAAALSVRLTAWHDAMVAHERKLRAGQLVDGCDDECPHAEARGLWAEAVTVFGPRADELTFLRTCAVGTPAQSKRDVVAREDASSSDGASRETHRDDAERASESGANAANELERAVSGTR